MISRLIKEAQDSGEVADSVDAEDFAITFSVLLDGLSIQVALKDPVVDIDRAMDIAMRFAAQRLNSEWS